MPILEDGLYLYLLQPEEEHGDQNGRATDAFWNRKTYRLDRITAEPSSHVLYNLEGGPNRSCVAEELMLVPENVEVPLSM